jgi:hypothetical protein
VGTEIHEELVAAVLADLSAAVPDVDAAGTKQSVLRRLTRTLPCWVFIVLFRMVIAVIGPSIAFYKGAAMSSVARFA